MDTYGQFVYRSLEENFILMTAEKKQKKTEQKRNQKFIHEEFFTNSQQDDSVKATYSISFDLQTTSDVASDLIGHEKKENDIKTEHAKKANTRMSYKLI
jgi:hypothetical protein